MQVCNGIIFLAARRIFYYMQGTRDLGLFYKKGEKSSIIGYTDCDYAAHQDDVKSTSGYVFMYGTGAISWWSKISLLSRCTEGEFVAATTCAFQAIGMRGMLNEPMFKQAHATKIYCDNTSTINVSKNSVLHGRSKHIDVKYYFLRDLCKDGSIDLMFCKREDQLPDICKSS